MLVCELPGRQCGACQPQHIFQRAVLTLSHSCELKSEGDSYLEVQGNMGDILVVNIFRAPTSLLTTSPEPPGRSFRVKVDVRGIPLQQKIVGTLSPTSLCNLHVVT